MKFSRKKVNFYFGKFCSELCEILESIDINKTRFIYDEFEKDYIRNIQNGILKSNELMNLQKRIFLTILKLAGENSDTELVSKLMNFLEFFACEIYDGLLYKGYDDDNLRDPELSKGISRIKNKMAEMESNHFGEIGKKN